MTPRDPKIGDALTAEELEPPCPFCGGKIAISLREHPAVIHSGSCEKFAALEPRAFLRAVRRELERKARN